MSNRLGVFYTCNDGYAPFAGVSMTSLLENNKYMQGLSLYVVGDGISAENAKKLADTAEKYGVPFELIDAAPVLADIAEIGVAAWRNTSITNARLFFEKAFAGRDLPERLLYLDCDTVITGNLAPLAEWQMGSCPLAMVADSLTGYYKEMLGFLPSERYYNGGVMLIDTAAWKEQNCTGYLTDALKNGRSDFGLGDQDITNIYFKGRIATLPPEYNSHPVHRAYTVSAFFKVYPGDGYYQPGQLALANSRPVILHTFRMFGDFPWHAGNLHPDTPKFDEYLQKSLWSDYVKQPSGGGKMFAVEKMLYRLLPDTLFLKLFCFLQTRSFRKQQAAFSANAKTDEK